MLILIGVVACSTPPAAVDADASDVPSDQIVEPSDAIDSATDLDDSDQPDETVDQLNDDPEPADVEDEPEVTRSACLSYAQPVARGALPPEVGEASGLAVVDGESTVLWLHNDSGDGPNLYAVSPERGLLATISLTDTAAIDWEDMTRGPCEAGDVDMGCLYVADIGDNYALRPWTVVYRITIPDAQLGDAELSDYTLMSLTYPDDPRDAEALVVDDQANIFILTKEREHEGTFRLYSTPFQPGARRIELTAHGEVDFSSLAGASNDLVTAADYDPFRRRLIVRTYSSAIEFRLPASTSLENLSTAPFVSVPIIDERQGESIAYGQEGYWHVSEGETPPIYFVECVNP